MKTTGLFTTHVVDVDLPGGSDTFRILPFGDVHRESPLHAVGHWKEFLAHAKAAKNVLFLGMGDYSDGVSTSERAVIQPGKLHDTTDAKLRSVYAEVAGDLGRELAFMRGRMIGLLGGNHYFDFGDGSTTDHVLAKALGTRFLGVSSFIRLRVRRATDRTRMNFDIFAHHGRGGGRLPGSTFNSLEQMTSIAEADLYLMGHDHKKGCISSSPRLRLADTKGSEVRLVERTPWLGRTGSFLKAYEPGQVSYNVDAGRSACALGWIEFEVTYVREGSGERRRSFRIRGTS